MIIVYHATPLLRMAGRSFKEGTLADGLAVPTVGPTSFKVAQHLVDRMCDVSEKMIAIAVLRLIETEKLVVEGGGSAALAAILPGGPLFGAFRGKTVWISVGAMANSLGPA